MTNNTKQQPLTAADLQQFTGDLQRFRHGLNRRVIYTPGVQYLAEAAGAYWLIDVIASYLTPALIAEEARKDDRIAWMQFWKLTVLQDGRAIVEARADSPCEPFIRQTIAWTDFPMESVDIWAAWDTQHWTLYLPSEH